MSVSLLAAPAIEPVSLADLKAHVRVTGTDEDIGLVALTVAARATVERLAHRYLITQSWRAHFDAIPPDGRLELPMFPVQSVIAVRTFSASGVATVVPASAFQVDATSEPARLQFADPVPQPGRPMAGVEVDAVVGYGLTEDTVPPPLRQAVLLLAARWYDRRGDDSGTPDLPDEVARLTEAFRPRRLVA